MNDNVCMWAECLRYSRCRLFCWTCFSCSFRLCLSGMSLPNHCWESCTQPERPAERVNTVVSGVRTVFFYSLAAGFVCLAHLQLLLQKRDFSDARLSGLVRLLHLFPLIRQTKPNILQFTLQLALLVILEETHRQNRSHLILKNSEIQTRVMLMEDKIFNLAFSVVEKEKRSGLAALICVDSCLTPRFSHFSQIYFHLLFITCWVWFFIRRDPLASWKTRLHFTKYLLRAEEWDDT